MTEQTTPRTCYARAGATLDTLRDQIDTMRSRAERMAARPCRSPQLRADCDEIIAALDRIDGEIRERLTMLTADHMSQGDDADHGHLATSTVNEYQPLLRYYHRRNEAAQVLHNAVPDNA